QFKDVSIRYLVEQIIQYLMAERNLFLWCQALWDIHPYPRKGCEYRQTDGLETQSRSGLICPGTPWISFRIKGQYHIPGYLPAYQVQPIWLHEKGKIIPPLAKGHVCLLPVHVCRKMIDFHEITAAVSARIVRLPAYRCESPCHY